MDSILEIYSMRETDRQRETDTDRQTDRDGQTETDREKSCTVLTTDGVVPHQNLIAVQNPLF